ncbi:CsgE family curli-type amyloid fiber assembly protein [Polaribacter sp. Hel1_85]|uniref:CsgE family curli-type amyloid fiber assembly protein n=1 Tax=Polaribacter sp. Hel1_85 TaxID=1250005 RepID=UPI00052E465C|nr:CsgE family curli-type amyloid fiber assembly protein [Polaribacter sp. Hel1_85]KGL58669.1 curli assembly protein CsgE [Polaribacter sp. Hel1_85]
MKNKIIVLLFVNVFFTTFYYAQEFDKYEVKGEINLTRIDDFLTLRAQVINEESFFINDLYYNFVVLKKGSSGNLSKNNQSNDFSLKPNEEKQLSVIKINLKKDEELKVYLFIKYKNKLIHRDTFFIKDKEVVKKEVGEEQFLIRGIVIDESMTKIGRDYHDFFYKEYLVTGKNYPFIVKIIEKPAMGRSSIISIEVDRNKIHEFFSRPNEDYLKANVSSAMMKLRAYSQKRKTTFSNKL